MSPPQVLLSVSLVVALASCDINESPPSPSPTPLQRPTGADELVVRVETRGGHLPPLEAERQIPMISIYGDGTVLVPAPTPDVFPGPAGYELLSFDIDGPLLDRIVARAHGLGLRGPDRRLEQEGPAFVADAGYTSVIVAVGGGLHVTQADALFDADEGSAERQQLAGFVRELLELRAAADDVTLYRPTAIAVYVAEPDPSFQPEPGRVEEVAWPFEPSLSEWGEPVAPVTVEVRCAVVGDEELGTGLPILEAATSMTVFVDADGVRRIAAFRPLLPDEARC